MGQLDRYVQVEYHYRPPVSVPDLNQIMADHVAGAIPPENYNSSLRAHYIDQLPLLARLHPQLPTCPERPPLPLPLYVDPCLCNLDSELNLWKSSGNFGEATKCECCHNWNCVCCLVCAFKCV